MVNYKGLILNDFNNHTYNMGNNKFHPIPTININKTIGKPMYKNPSNYNISFWINQMNTSVCSY